MTAIQLERPDVAPAPAPRPRRRTSSVVVAAIAGVAAGILLAVVVQFAQTRNTAPVPASATLHLVHVTTSGGDCSVLKDGDLETQVAGQVGGGGCDDDIRLTGKPAVIHAITAGTGPNSCSITIDGAEVASATGVSSALCSYMFKP